jgi:hypothetical protein
METAPRQPAVHESISAQLEEKALPTHFSSPQEAIRGLTIK